jgi:hypothetical protein
MLSQFTILFLFKAPCSLRAVWGKGKTKRITPSVPNIIRDDHTQKKGVRIPLDPYPFFCSKSVCYAANVLEGGLKGHIDLVTLGDGVHHALSAKSGGTE